MQRYRAYRAFETRSLAVAKQVSLLTAIRSLVVSRTVHHDELKMVGRDFNCDCGWTRCSSAHRASAMDVPPPVASHWMTNPRLSTGQSRPPVS